MSISFKISCTCFCEYTINDKVCTNKICCSNCGTEYPYSDKLISVIKTASEIPDGNLAAEEIETKIISD